MSRTQPDHVHEMLHRELHALAEEVAPRADAPSGADLWLRGVRFRRRIRTGTVVVVAAALALLAVLTGVTLRQAAPPPAPAPADAPVGLPSRIHEPGPWLPGTAEDGPLGQLVAVISGVTRGGWSGSSTGVVGVSAVTGEYRFLDLPDQVAETDVALAPDGRHLAYWTTGPVTDSPNERPTVAGLGIYDAVAGEAVGHHVSSPHGLWPDALAWVDESRVLAGFHHWAGGEGDTPEARSTGLGPSLLQWDLAEEQPEPWTRGERHALEVWGVSNHGRNVALDGRERFWFLGEAPPGGLPSRRVAGGSVVNVGAGLAVSPDGTRVAGIWDGSVPNEVSVQRIGGFESNDLRGSRIQGTKAFAVLGWSNDRHLAVLARVPGDRWSVHLAVHRLDVATGRSEEVVALPPGASGGTRVAWATDLLGAPVVDRPAPPDPLDPRLVATAAVAVVVGAALLAWRWRRRVEP